MDNEQQHQQQRSHKPDLATKDFTRERLASGIRRNQTKRELRLQKKRGLVLRADTDTSDFAALLAKYSGARVLSKDPSIASRELSLLNEILRHGNGVSAEPHYQRLFCKPKRPGHYPVLHRLVGLLSVPAAATDASLALLNVTATSHHDALRWIRALITGGGRFCHQATLVLCAPHGAQALSATENVLWALSNIALESEACRDAMLAHEPLRVAITDRVRRACDNSPETRVQRWVLLPQLMRLLDALIVQWPYLPEQDLVRSAWKLAVTCLLNIEPLSDDESKADAAKYALFIVWKISCGPDVPLVHALLREQPKLLPRIVHIAKAISRPHTITLVGSTVLLSFALDILLSVEGSINGDHVARVVLDDCEALPLLHEFITGSRPVLRRKTAELLAGFAADGARYVHRLCSTNGILASVLSRQISQEVANVRRELLLLVANCVNATNDASVTPEQQTQLLSRLCALRAPRHLCKTLRLNGEVYLWVEALRALRVLLDWDQERITSAIYECDGAESIEEKLTDINSDVYNEAQYIVDRYLEPVNADYAIEETLDIMDE